MSCRLVPSRRSWGPLRRALEADGTLDAYERIDVPLVAVLAIIERTGAAIDTDRLEALGRETGASVDELRARIIELAGEDFNVDSPKQLGHILFEVIGLTPRKKNQRGYSTDASVLKELGERARASRLGAALSRAGKDQVYLHRRASALARRRRARPHDVQRDRYHDRPSFFVRPEPAEYPCSHGFRPSDPRVLCAACTGRGLPFGGLLPDRSNCACLRIFRATRG